jgi:hypothetical protein
MIENRGSMIIHYRPDPKKPYRLTAEEKRKLDETPIDYSDIPELDDEFFKNAVTVNWPQRRHS